MRERRGLQLTCGPTCNVFNLIYANLMRTFGVHFINLPWEADYELIRKFSDRRWSDRFGITIYGAPPLMTSRIKVFESSDPLLLFGRDWTPKVFPRKFALVRSRETFCAPSVLLKNELKNFAFWQIQVDSISLVHSKRIYTILHSLKDEKALTNTSSFNMKSNKKYDNETYLP